MELLGRVCTALGISLILTLLLLVLYQDDGQQRAGSAAMTQISTAADPITPSPAGTVSVR
ncbi:MAG: hypothetical protein ACRD1W_01990 [Vicinamibacterales bacterium]